MASTLMPDDYPLEAGKSAGPDDDASDHAQPDSSDWVSEGEEAEPDDDVEASEAGEEKAGKDIEKALDKVTDEVLIANKIIPAERGYTIQQLQNGDEDAWKTVCARFLKIAVFKFNDIVCFHLPGVDADEAKSAVVDIVADLAEKIADYHSEPELEAAFRTALRRDIRDLQRKFLTKKRGEGKIDVTSELHGLDQKDALSDRTSISDDDEAPSVSTLESKINREFGGWSSLKDDSASVSANRRDQKTLMSEAMEELKPAERELLQLRFISGLKLQDIADRQNKNVKQIGSEINRAKIKLKKLVAEKMLRDKKNLL